MKLFKRDPVLGVVILATVLVLGAESWLLVQASRQARQTLTGLDAIRRERESFQRQSVPPCEENERAIVQELADLRLRLTAARAALTGSGKREGSSLPTQPIEGYFDIANFVEKTRTLATQTHVAINPDERFGFGSHASDGPPIELLPAVHDQRVAVEILVGVLFEALPSSLLLVQRERPMTAAQHAARAASRPIPPDTLKSKSTHDEPADFFELPPSLSLRIPGVLDSDGFALEFSGQARTLRDFMNRIATGELAMIVRSIEVERLSDASSFGGGSRSASDANSSSIVGPSVSRFRVIVELVKPWAEIEGAE